MIPDWNGATEVVTHGLNGLIVGQGDAESVERFNLASMIAEFEALFEGLILPTW